MTIVLPKKIARFFADFKPAAKDQAIYVQKQTEKKPCDWKEDDSIKKVDNLSTCQRREVEKALLLHL